jgi:hypothetical protein
VETIRRRGLEVHDRTVGEVVAAVGGSAFKPTGDGVIAPDKSG